MTDKDRDIARGIPGEQGESGGEAGGFKSANEAPAKKEEGKEGEEKKEGEGEGEEKKEGAAPAAEGEEKKVEEKDDEKKEGGAAIAAAAPEKKDEPKKAGGPPMPFLPPELGGPPLPSLSQKHAKILGAESDPELDEINIGGEHIIVGSLGEENMQMDDDLRSHDIVEYLQTDS